MIKSSKPEKQRKFSVNAPFHIRHKMISGHLSKDLRAQYNRRALPIRQKDVVVIMRGENKGKKGEVIKVDLKNYKIYVSGIIMKKADGKEVPAPVHPSNCLITDLFIEDRFRRKVLERTVKEQK